MKPSTGNLVFWAVLAVIAGSGDAIRVYEGTNIPAPTPAKPQKTAGFSKKSLYISKRSWSGPEEKPTEKSDGRLEGKWREGDKRTPEGAPTLYKIKFADKTFKQYLRYIKEIPRLEEYTLCLWYKSENLTHDQTLFSYALNKDEILLRFWINAFDSTLRTAIRENTVYKVPANIREHRWHHVCQSWNGVLGEWQVFLDGKRIGGGVLSRYEGTYIPEGGEVTVGQELAGKRLHDGIDGEVFGFNLVDESVPHDEGLFINSQYRPNLQAGVPPFKKLPQIKKTYQEIKAYITSLPKDAEEAANVIKKPKETYSSPPKRSRGNGRVRYPPLRKVVVYNRDDRQLDLDERPIELNRTRPVLPERTRPAANGTDPEQVVIVKTAQAYDENYSIHSYRPGKAEKNPVNYEIYEVLEEDPRPPAEDQLLERKARQNFNLFTARQANRVYTLSNAVKDAKKPRFHFETMEEPEKVDSGRGVAAKETRARGAAEETTGSPPSDSIPVYEVEIGAARRRRSAEGKRESRQFTTGDQLADSNGFRRLPRIPESFINLFGQNASRADLREKLDSFFPASNATEESNVVPAVAAATPVPQVVTPAPTTAGDPVPTFVPMPETRQEAYAALLGNPGPVSFPVIREFNPRPAAAEPGSPPARPELPLPLPPPVQGQNQMERRFQVSSGTDLVMRSYGECTANRGSPVGDKDRLVLSWADTPVRIFGGAMVERARNECGNF